MEILDYLTAFASYRYNNVSPVSKIATMVTASVDEISLFKQININNPLILTAYPTYTGDSSMEIRLDIYNNNSDYTESCDKENDHFLGSAYFVYVMRDAKDYSKKKKVLAINFSNYDNSEEDKKRALIRYDIGKENKLQRIENSNNSLLKKPPTQEESAILHREFVSYKTNLENKKMTKQLHEQQNKLNIKTNTIDETKVEISVLMQSQNMNVNGHVFGGYIMKEALELGYVCAYLHANRENATTICIDQVNFIKPVIIGSIARFKAEVCLVRDELIHVCVEVYNLVGEHSSPAVLTTTVNITYQTKTPTANVIPTTYESGVKYLDATRRLNNLFNLH
jgi:acyl-coenzyme A thioesterase 9